MGSRGADQTTTSSSLASGDVIVIVDLQVCVAGWLAVISDSLEIFCVNFANTVSSQWPFLVIKEKKEKEVNHHRNRTRVTWEKKGNHHRNRTRFRCEKKWITSETEPDLPARNKWIITKTELDSRVKRKLNPHRNQTRFTCEKEMIHHRNRTRFTREKKSESSKKPNQIYVGKKWIITETEPDSRVKR